MSAREQITGARRVVVKLGTHVVTHDGVKLALGRLHTIIEDLSALHTNGLEILLVSSGAIGMGMRALAMAQRPDSLGLRQACAAVGQGQLMGLYTQAFATAGVTTAQVLLTSEDLADRDRALAVRTTLLRLLELRTLPVLNENDSVSVTELLEHAGGFGDNDGLSARVAIALDADALILLSDVDGVFQQNPKTHPDAARIETITDFAAVGADLTGSSAGGTGGMATKFEAAKAVTAAGAAVVIASGATPHVLARLLAGENLGTYFPAPAPRSARRRHIAVDADAAGAVVVNPGAIEALGSRKASLLPIGVESVVGEFARGDVVEIRDRAGRVYGRGLSNYSAAACRKLAGQHSSKIEEILGYRGYDAIITRDNLAWSES